jgi:hypothetical protein
VKYIYATGYEEIIRDDRPFVAVSGGAGNCSGVPEIHLHAYDPIDGRTVQFWVPRDELLAAILHPEDAE